MDFALNRKDHDMIFDTTANGLAAIKLVDGADAIAQKIKISLMFWLGEWYQDTTKGLPFLDVIFKKGTADEVIESIIRSRIVAVAGVQRVTDFSLERTKDRYLIVNWTALTAERPISGSTLLDTVR